MRKIILMGTILASIAGFAQKPIFTTAKAKAATVYFNAAELTQSTSVNLPAGTSEVVIKNVANSLNENTIQIGAPASVTVLSVQFTNNYISEFEPDANSPMIKRVRDSITLVQKEIAKLQNERYSDTKTLELLDKNQQVAGQNSGLNVAELMKLVEYYRIKRTDISNAIAVLQERETKWNDVLQNLNTKLEINNKEEEKTSTGKLILQIMNDVAGIVPLDINYITNTASWVPFYDLRADNITSPINMMYKAQVRQTSGIDWKKVKLSLSSGYPNQNNLAPQLQPWFLNYYTERIAEAYDKKEDSRSELDEVVVTAYKATNGKVSGIAVSNVNANQIETQLTVSFDIDIPYDILSNGKVHSVALKEIKLPATYKFYAAPRAEKEAFLMANISDYSKYNLLPGEANIIFEGMYVGKTTINPNETSDTLNLSMGRDKKISIKREKVIDKSGTKFLSSYKEQTFTYDITIRNNKKETIEMLLKDQYPISPDKDVTVTLLQSDRAQVSDETGMLSWELKLAPNETKKIRISYKIRYPKNRIINNL
ncbi:MAG TPA: DUF4139 domain-containing protein [Flavobacterium sp.]|nr:DUF4139 domain-containing protein [Flavobacterium sp.]